MEGLLSTGPTPSSFIRQKLRYSDMVPGIETIVHSAIARRLYQITFCVAPNCFCNGAVWQDFWITPVKSGFNAVRLRAENSEVSSD